MIALAVYHAVTADPTPNHPSPRDVGVLFGVRGRVPEAVPPTFSGSSAAEVSRVFEHLPRRVPDIPAELARPPSTNSHDIAMFSAR